MDNSFSQQELFNASTHTVLNEVNAPQLALKFEAIAWLNQAKRICALQTEQIADRMNLCLRDTDEAVTKAQLDKWLSPKTPHQFPLCMMPAYCWATSCDLPIVKTLETLGLKAVNAREDLMRSVTERGIAAAKATEEMKSMMDQLIKGAGS